MKLFQTTSGPIFEYKGNFYRIDADWDSLFNTPNLYDWLKSQAASQTTDNRLKTLTESPLKPLVKQEIWAAGVTYFRSRTARMEESQTAGGGDFYDRVYSAERPEIFFKSSPHRCVGPGESMLLRADSKWIVPEPELVLAINGAGEIFGYSIGNDLSCRDIEGENPLYLPQAKTFDRCAAVGPCILISPTPPSPDTEIGLRITRGETEINSDQTTLAQMKRSLTELVDFLFRHNSHPFGCLLMTGTGIVPPDNFTLNDGDLVEISIGGIGTLANTMSSS